MSLQLHRSGDGCRQRSCAQSAAVVGGSHTWQLGMAVQPQSAPCCSHSPQLWQQPAPPGAAPQCQPALTTPTPGFDVMVEPSAATVPHPMVTNSSRSWSYENISTSAPGL